MEDSAHPPISSEVAQQVVHQSRHERVRGPGKVAVTLRVNGEEHQLFVEPRRTLLDALRLDLAMTGTKLVCGRGECGACTVLVDGEPVYSCLMLAVEYGERDVETIEGLSPDGQLHPVQEAFIRTDAYQCGFCTPGQVLAIKALLDQTDRPTEEQVRQAVSGNICRCGAYHRIVRAGLLAAGAIEE